jgi:colanic acid biosynthesis glycosyl transferase WcaI
MLQNALLNVIGVLYRVRNKGSKEVVMTHILFITPYFPPEKAAPAVRISETAARLVRRGHQVTVLTTVPNYPTGIVPVEYRGHAIQQEILDGTRVIRVWSYTSPNKGFLRRILAQLSFALIAPILGGKAVGQPEVIIVESPPLFDAIAGRILAWWKCCPFIFVVSDLWPASAVQLEMLKNRILIRLAEWLEWSTYQRAGLVWAVTKGIRQSLLARRLPPERVFLLTNGVDTTKFRPQPQAQARAMLDWEDRFTVIYTGTHGLAHGLTTVLEAAERLRDRSEIRFVLVGDGAAKEDLVSRAQQRDLKNVTFLEPQPHDQIPLLLAASDACLAPLRKLPLFEGALPSKIYEAMACARPVLLGVEGEARQIFEQEAGAALAVEPENPDALAAAILYLYEHPRVAKDLGSRGRAFVESHYDREQLSIALESQINTLIGKVEGTAIPQEVSMMDTSFEQG